MIAKRYYECEKCHRQYDNEQDAVDCEMQHATKMPKRIIGLRGAPAFGKPENIVIELANGEKWQYVPFAQLEETHKYKEFKPAD